MVACGLGASILLLSTQTGEPVARFDDAHPGGVTCLAFGPGQLLFSGGKDGRMQAWDYLKEEPCLQNHFIAAAEVLALCVAPTDPTNTLYLTLGYPKHRHHQQAAAAAKEEKLSYKVLAYNIKDKFRTKLFSLKNPPIFLQPSSTGEHLIGACSTRLIVWHIPSAEILSEVIFDDLTPREGSFLQSVALHPTRPEIATGDIEGRVYIWHTLYNKLGTKLKHAKAKPFHSLSTGNNYNSSNSSMHLLKRKMFRSEIKRWHAHGVSCLSFTPDGHYLLSGGEEAVLVICQLSKGGQPTTFLPRLGARLVHLSLSEDGALCAVTTQGNSLRVLHPLDLKIRWEHRGLAHLSTTAAAAATVGGGGAAGGGFVDMSEAARLWGGSTPGVLVSNCLPGKLQFFDVSKGGVTGEVEVVSTNVVSRGSEAQGGGGEGGREGGRVVPPWVTHAALSCEGRFLVTVEARVGEEGIKRGSLKFWERGGGGGGGREGRRGYSLVSVVDRPHESQGQGQLLALAYHPRLDLVASCSASGAFSLWARVSERGEEEEEEGGRGGGYNWTCQASVPFQRGVSRCIAFSADGTLLAVGCGASVALWDPLAVRLVGMLVIDPSLPPSLASSSKDKENQEIHSVAFIPNTPRLVTACKKGLVVWDLLSLSPLQQYAAGKVLHLRVPSPQADPKAVRVEGGKEGEEGREGGVVHFAAVLEGEEDGKRSNPSSSSFLSAAPVQSIVLFNAFQAAPLLTHPLPPRAGPVLSLAFVESQSGSGGGGVCYMTKEGVSLLGPSIPSFLHQQQQQQGGHLRRMLGATAAAVALEMVGGGNSSSSSSSSSGKRQLLALHAGAGAPGAIGAAAVVAAAAAAGGRAAKKHKPVSVSELLGTTTTGHLPKPSAVFDTFLSGLLPSSSSSSTSSSVALPPSFPSLTLPPPPQHSAARKGPPHQQQQQQQQQQPRVQPSAGGLPAPGLKKDLMALLVEGFRRGKSSSSSSSSKKSGRSSSSSSNGGKAVVVVIAPPQVQQNGGGCAQKEKQQEKKEKKGEEEGGEGEEEEVVLVVEEGMNGHGNHVPAKAGGNSSSSKRRKSTGSNSSSSKSNNDQSTPRAVKRASVGSSGGGSSSRSSTPRATRTSGRKKAPISC